MTLSALLLAAALAPAFAESKALVVQIELDRAGYSANALDGAWGAKSRRAAAAFLAAQGVKPTTSAALEPDWLYDNVFKARARNPYRVETVTAADLAALVAIPDTPEEKERLDRLGYESIKEMFAERGHLTERALERLNPGVDWANVAVGTRIRLPDFAAAAPTNEAACVRISLSRFEIRAEDANGRLLALFPCSIARDKAALPPQGELTIVTRIADPNYTLDRKYILPPGPNTPVGTVWLGLSLPGYGIHGTPRPETIGRAESHGCFRLANWNAARLYALVRAGTRVVIEE